MSDKESKWYQSSLLSQLVDVFTDKTTPNVDASCDIALRLMKDHTLRKTTCAAALSEFTLLAGKVVEVRKGLHESFDKAVEAKLPTVDDVSSMEIDEVAALKKELSLLISACDKKVSEQQQQGK